MSLSRSSKLDDIVANLQKHLNPAFWQGRGNRNSFKRAIKDLLSENKISKDEYNYIQKNERRVLTKAQLIHIMPEIQSQEVLENTLKNLSQVIVRKKSSGIETSKEKVQKDLVRIVEDHMKQVFEPKFGSVSEEFSNVIDIIMDSVDVSLELEKISNKLTSIRDTLLEKGYSRMLIYDIDRLAARMVNLTKKSAPGEMPSRDELADYIKQLQYRYEIHNKE
ncbi:MAG: hypothetical protein ACTSQE_08770 [Candidatus Heimdallarchaeaceae archaeon]